MDIFLAAEVFIGVTDHIAKNIIGLLIMTLLFLLYSIAFHCLSCPYGSITGEKKLLF